MDLKKLVTALLLGVGALLYIGGIWRQGWLALHQCGDLPPFHCGDLPPFLHHAVTTIGAVLGTYFGAVFGVRAQALRARDGSLFQALRQALTGAGEPPPFSVLQAVAVLLYLLGLLVALFVWFELGFVEAAPELIKSMSATLLGVIAGMLAIMLNVKPTSPPPPPPQPQRP